MNKKIFKDKYRLSVFISNQYIYAQVIYNGSTVASASSIKMTLNPNINTAKLVGELVAKSALDAGVTNVVFDRGRRKYHGRIKALADMARASGLVF